MVQACAVMIFGVNTPALPGQDIPLAGITLRPLATIGSIGDPASPTFAARAAVLGESIVAGPVFDRGYLYVYGRDGSYRTRIGGPGDGPGELGEAPAFVLKVWDDSLFVANMFRPRIYVFGPNLEFHHEVRIPTFAFDFQPHVKGFVVGPGSTSIPHVVVLDGDGRPTRRSAYAQVSTGTVSPQLAKVRYLGPGPEGVWEARRYDYRLTLLEPGTARAMRVLNLDRSWQGLPSEPWRRTHNTTGPSGIWQEGGLLWVLSHIASGETYQFGALSTPEAMDRAFDTVVEVLDPMSGRLIARREDERHLRAVSGGSYLSHIKSTSLGDYQLDILHLSLVKEAPYYPSMEERHDDG